MAAVQANADAQLLQLSAAPHSRGQHTSQLAPPHHQIVGRPDAQRRCPCCSGQPGQLGSQLGSDKQRQLAGIVSRRRALPGQGGTEPEATGGRLPAAAVLAAAMALTARQHGQGRGASRGQPLAQQPLGAAADGHHAQAPGQLELTRRQGQKAAS